MNTTKLHIIARSLRDELQRCDTVSLLQQAIKALEQIIRQPQQPAHQQQLSTFLTQLYQKLEKSPVDEYSPAWRDAMDELKVSHEFGKALHERVASVIERNQITYQAALEELNEIFQEIQKTESNLNGLVHGLEYFGVGEDELNADECEIGIVIPRKYVDNNLKSFGHELVELEKTLIVFSELSTGTRQPLKIRTISSSELSVFIDYIPQVGACVAVAVERIVALYKQMLEIKKLKAELLKQEVPDEQLKGINDYAESAVSPKLEEIAIELLEKYGSHIEENRKNEVSTELRHSLNKLANRIDRGFNIELRVTHVSDEVKDGDHLSEHDIAVQQIIDSARNIEYSQSSGDPVLFLPEQNEDDEK